MHRPADPAPSAGTPGDSGDSGPRPDPDPGGALVLEMPARPADPAGQYPAPGEPITDFEDPPGPGQTPAGQPPLSHAEYARLVHAACADIDRRGLGPALPATYTTAGDPRRYPATLDDEGAAGLRLICQQEQWRLAVRPDGRPRQPGSPERRAGGVADDPGTSRSWLPAI